MCARRRTQVRGCTVDQHGNFTHIEQCCRDNGVEQQCVQQLCKLDNSPSPFHALSIAMSCRDYFPNVAPCLAGRHARDSGHERARALMQTARITRHVVNPRVCRAVVWVCAPVTPLPSGHIRCCVCPSIYTQSIRVFESITVGYNNESSSVVTELLAPPPQRVRVMANLEDYSQVQVLWNVPATNADKAIAYSMFVRRDLGMHTRHARITRACRQRRRLDTHRQRDESSLVARSAAEHPVHDIPDHAYSVRRQSAIGHC